ncbi:polyprenyl synthetase family protein [Anaerobiospirillum succiniciproducens]|uniref:polyprenyl synthetase family protein n=1 Tax=Anaerobiospirillum succiniciproducens TaxID=13335 RepID=UPI000420A90D|nr:polyprenyl synthetase family protein [Anaerobiospirillum succiniciproducens]
MVADTIASETLINKSLERVEELLSATYTQHQLETAVNAMCMHVINAGGKRIRPRLAVMSALALPHYNEELHYEKICHIAAAFEMLHTATLVHDDVIDKASMRRGQPTLNDTSGNHAAVLAGDYLFTRCFDLIAYPEEFGVIKALNRTLSELVVGELYQLENEGNSNISYETYYRTIYAKTGVLFELSASAPAIIIKEDSALEAPLREYGRQLGIAFQIKDDMLDYSADAEALGKDPGTDLADGRITLPVLIALNRSNEQEREQLLEDIKEANLEAVKAAIARTNAMQECERQSQEACDKAIACLDVLEDSPYKQGLIAVCKKAVARNS